MGLWSVSMLVAAELLWVLRVPSTVEALAQALVQVNFLTLRQNPTPWPCRAQGHINLPAFGFLRESSQPTHPPPSTWTDYDTPKFAVCNGAT
jgi:hypothetical protein